MPSKTKDIKSKDRVRDLGEVFTQSREVNDMLDLIPTCSDISSKVLEPSCGNGNFLVEILNRRLNVLRGRYGIIKNDVLHLRSEFDVMCALSTMYGVDIMEDNVAETRYRLLNIALDFLRSLGNDCANRSDLVLSFDKILATNIQVGDMLNGTDKIEFTEFVPNHEELTFDVMVYKLSDMEKGNHTHISEKLNVYFLSCFEMLGHGSD